MEETTNNYSIYQMIIIDKKKDDFYIKVTSNRSTIITYNPQLKILTFISDNETDKELIKNKYQLSKILNNKKANTFHIGFELKFVLRDNLSSIDFNDLSKIIVLDRQNVSS